MIKFFYLPAFIAAFLLASPAYAGQILFDTPLQGADALVEAAKTGDSKRILDILGEEGRDIVSSGDAVADKQERQNFVKAYEEKHNIQDEENEAILEIGPTNWPFPIPIVKEEKGWRFDTAQGRKEIAYRRVGRNEINVIMTSLAYVDAQNEYAQMMREEKGNAEYAQRVISNEGKKDGLYWPAAAGEAPSPLGELMAQASAEGYDAGKKDKRSPYHGYYYKILTRQGPAAKGGAIDYIANGAMTGGFGLIAWPAKYRNSGVMTFVVNNEGQVYQQDLGPETEKIAAEIEEFDPVPGWSAAERITPDGKPQAR